MGAPRRGAGIDQDGHLWLQRKRPCLYTAPPIGAAGIRSPAPSLTSEDSAGPPALNPAAKMSQTTYYLPVTFARPQDPSTRSDAPAAGGSPQAPSANGGEAVANKRVLRRNVDQGVALVGQWLSRVAVDQVKLVLNVHQQVERVVVLIAAKSEDAHHDRNRAVSIEPLRS